MIEFKTIRVKNFMSYGNVPTEVDLRGGKVLIVGQNGSGKSSIWLDGITYALYGKPFRNINIPQLQNSINQKECLVEVEFDIGPNSYLVRRGMKPGRFEIFKDGELIKQDAAAKDYQEFLERNILRINRKTFTQVLILGSAVFVPFMQQPPGTRREIIEDIFDISVFGKMHKILKRRVDSTKEDLRVIDVKISSAKKESLAQKRLIDSLVSMNKDQLNTLTAERIDLINQQMENDSLISNETECQAKIAQQLAALPEDSDDIDFKVAALETTENKLKSNLAKIKTLVTCPTCKQEVGDEHKHLVEVGIDKQLEANKEQLDLSRKVLNEVKASRVARRDLERQRDESVFRQKIIHSEVEAILRRIVQIDDSISALHQSSNANIEKEKDSLKELAASALELIERKNELITEQHIQSVALTLLKDSGIKASIVREYLPVLNRLINKYLTEFEFFVNFELDENFSETIKSRGRDDFTYDSFSEGEKRRIDLAVLLSFRHIASLKNSAKVNLIVCDEVDNGLDPSSLEKFVELIIGLDSHAWVISHVIANTELINQFEGVVEIEKRGDFSHIKSRG